MKLAVGKTSIRSLHAHATAVGAHEVAGQVQRANLLPAGLPTQAILCVRVVRESRPVGPGGRRGQGRPSDEWQQGVRERLASALREAARPALAPPPAGSTAVLFADHAELLACLAADWCDGALAGHWWWRTLFAAREPSDLMPGAWQEQPEQVPAALARLAERGRAVAVAERLPLPAIQALLSSVLHRFGLSDLRSLVDRTFDRVPSASAPAEAGPDGGVCATQGEAALLQSTLAGAFDPKDQEGENARTGRRRTDPPHPFAPVEGRPHGKAAPWQRWAPEAASRTLAAERRVFLGTLLTLQRAPAVVRDAAYAAALLTWQEVPSTTRLPEAPAAADPAIDLHGREAQLPGEGPLESRSSGGRHPTSAPWSHDDPAAAPAPGSDDWQPGGTAPAAVQAGTPKGDGPAADSGRPAQPGASAVSSAPLLTTAAGSMVIQPRAASLADSEALQEGVRGDRSSADPTVDHPAPPAVPWRQPGAQLRVRTQLGGAFFLINVGLALGLYGDFTTPAEPGIDLPLWDFLAIVAGELLGGTAEDDPLWGLLAMLADREPGVAPGHAFAAPEHWQLPTDWLVAFPERATWCWASEDARLRLWHPAGFWLLDLPRSAAPATVQVARATSCYAAGADFTLRRRGNFPRPAAANPLQRWRSWFMAYLRARLRRALGGEDADIPTLLCRQPGDVLATDTTLDVTLSLATLPVAIRLAGLDRDPGWVPAAGRDVRFHFT